MNVEFKIKDHSHRPCKIVEVFVDGEFRAAIYPDEQGGIRVVSTHLRAEPAQVPLGEGGIWQFLFERG